MKWWKIISIHLYIFTPSFKATYTWSILKITKKRKTRYTSCPRFLMLTFTHRPKNILNHSVSLNFKRKRIWIFYPYLCIFMQLTHSNFFQSFFSKRISKLVLLFVNGHWTNRSRRSKYVGNRSTKYLSILNSICRR